jgi:WD40 repeat protein
VAFSSDGSTLASGSVDKNKTIWLWDVKSGKGLQTLTGHSDSVDSVAISSDRSTLASGSHGSTIEDHPIPFLQRRNDPSQAFLDPKVSLSNYWISLAGEKLIHVPPEYHRLFCSAVQGATIALGCGNGRILVIGFTQHRPALCT